MAHNSRSGKFLMQTIGDLADEVVVKPALNIITGRNRHYYMDLPAIKPSKTLTEAQLKARRLYKRICRYVR